MDLLAGVGSGFSRTSRFLAIAGIVICSESVSSLPQSTSADATFEVASVTPETKHRQPFTPVDLAFLRAVARNVRDGRYQLPFGPVSVLIEAAYDIDDSQLLGAPAWVRS